MSSSIRLRSERGWLCAVLFVLGGLVSLPAVGAEISPQAKEQAREKFNAGNAAYARGDFRQALTDFETAYQLAPLPGFLFNVAQCHRQLGAFERAASAYRRYLALSEKEPANAETVKELIAEMDAQARQGTASRAGKDKPGAQGKVREKPRTAAAPVKVPEASGAPTRDRSGLKEAEQRALDIRKSRTLSAAPKSLPPGAVPQAPTPAPESSQSLTRKWWVWAGAGAAILLTGGIVYAATAPESRPATLGTIPAR